MSHRLTITTLALASAVALVAGQTAAPGAKTQVARQAAPASTPTPAPTPDERWRRAQDAWNLGKYPDALADLKALMQSSAAAEYRDRVALLTGELYVTTELTTDGRNPKISADGQYASFETGPTAAAITRVVRLGSPVQEVASLATANVAFDPTSRRLAWLRQTAGASASSSEIVVRDLSTGTERVWIGAGTTKSNLMWSGDGQAVLFVGIGEDATRSDVYSVREGAAAVRLTDEPGIKTGVLIDPGVSAIVYSAGRAGGPGAAPGARGAVPGAPTGAPAAAGGRAGGGGAGGGGRGGAAPTAYTILDVKAKTTRSIAGSMLTMSADGSTLAWITRDGDAYTLNKSATLGGPATTVRTGRERINAPALSPDGKQIAYEFVSGIGSSTDTEIYVTDATGAHRRVTRDIQHDILPRFLTNDTLLGMIGEARHRRAHIYDLTTGTRTRVFANNTVRTISPEYVWTPSADGKHLAIQAERDGDTVSTERGIYVTDLSRQQSVADVLARVDRQLADENDLRQRMTKAYQPIADLVRRVVAVPSATRAYEYEKAQFDFDSKHVSQPGNAKAIAYLEKTYASFGYTPDVQWFQTASNAQNPTGFRTANIVSTLKGTENPDLIYVVSSHFDSVAIGPGADDDTSGTCALLETARALSKTPLPATVVFASFTGEEAGLLGSREFVRVAAEKKWNIVGALNNDMIGWAGESARMDNTIRYSNAGIRDIQHGAAFLFTNLILYDAKYYKSTDAAAFYDGWGDIVGGIGSYPVLSNPNYHQTTHLIETINFQQVAETAKVTAATLVYLASSPSRLKNIKAAKSGTGVEVSWTPSPEAGVKTYIVAYGPATDPMKTRLTVTGPRALLPAIPAGTQIAVKGVNSRGLEGWDWAKTVVE